MTHPEASHRVKVGVLLAREAGDLGEWLRDAAAFDAAGADALWLDVDAKPDLDPLAVAAALAVVTFRSQLFVSLPDDDMASPTLPRLLATIDRLSRSRVRVVADAGALPEVVPGIGVLRRIPGDPDALEDAHLEVARRWTLAPLPDGRANWHATHAAATGQGVHGLIVPASSRLLDLLRNPDDLGDRRDLQLAVG